MTVKSSAFDDFDLGGGAGALSADLMSTVEYVCWLFLSPDIWYTLGAVSACEFPALLALLDAKRLYIDHKCITFKLFNKQTKE